MTPVFKMRRCQAGRLERRADRTDPDIPLRNLTRDQATSLAEWCSVESYNHDDDALTDLFVFLSLKSLPFHTWDHAGLQLSPLAQMLSRWLSTTALAISLLLVGSVHAAADEKTRLGNQTIDKVSSFCRKLRGVALLGSNLRSIGCPSRMHECAKPVYL